MYCIQPRPRFAHTPPDFHKGHTVNVLMEESFCYCFFFFFAGFGLETLLLMSFPIPVRARYGAVGLEIE